MTDLRSPEEVLGNILRADTAQAAAAIIRADREQVERDTIRRVVEWLRERAVIDRSIWGESIDTRADAVADAIEAGEWKGTDHDD